MSRSQRLKEFFDSDFRVFAHRGFHGQQPENSMASFEAAMAHGFGIETDVQLCRSGELLVFHDDHLDGCAHIEGQHSGRIRERDLSQLRDLRFTNGERMPLLEEVLDLVQGRVPLIIEVKVIEPLNWKRAVASAAELLKTLRSQNTPEQAVLIASFHPFVLGQVRKHAPQRLRSQISESHADKRVMVKNTLKRLYHPTVLSSYSQPDVLMVEHNALTPKRRQAYQRRGLTLLPWMGDGRNVLKGLKNPGESQHFANALGKVMAQGCAGFISDHPQQAQQLSDSQRIPSSTVESG